MQCKDNREVDDHYRTTNASTTHMMSTVSIQSIVSHNITYAALANPLVHTFVIGQRRNWLGLES